MSCATVNSDEIKTFSDMRSDTNNKPVFFFKQKTAYEMRISDWSSDVCSSDLRRPYRRLRMSLVRPLLRTPQADRWQFGTAYHHRRHRLRRPGPRDSIAAHNP